MGWLLPNHGMDSQRSVTDDKTLPRNPVKMGWSGVGPVTNSSNSVMVLKSLSFGFPIPFLCLSGIRKGKGKAIDTQKKTIHKELINSFEIK